MLELIEDKEDVDYVEECLIRQVCSVGINANSSVNT